MMIVHQYQKLILMKLSIFSAGPSNWPFFLYVRSHASSSSSSSNWPSLCSAVHLELFYTSCWRLCSYSLFPPFRPWILQVPWLVGVALKDRGFGEKTALESWFCVTRRLDGLGAREVVWGNADVLTHYYSLLTQTCAMTVKARSVAPAGLEIRNGRWK